jgi:hypothetical protein
MSDFKSSIPLNLTFVPWRTAETLSKPRNPYDISTWGPECGRGIRYAQTGAPVASGTKGVVRKISQGRKSYRGMASDGVK